MAVRGKTPSFSEQEVVIHKAHTTAMKTIVWEIKTSSLQGASDYAQKDSKKSLFRCWNNHLPSTRSITKIS